jgi:hypothetical protein
VSPSLLDLGNAKHIPRIIQALVHGRLLVGTLTRRFSGRGVSIIVSALLLISIVMTAGGLFYGYSAGLLGPLQPPPPRPPENLVIEMIAFNSNGAALVTVRNIGMGNSYVAAIYVNGNPVIPSPAIPTQGVPISVNQAYTFTLPGPYSPTQYWFKVVTLNGFIVSTYGPQIVYMISYTTQTLTSISTYTTTIAVTSTFYSTLMKTTSSSTSIATFSSTSTSLSTSTVPVSTYYTMTSSSTSLSSASSTYYTTTKSKTTTVTGKLTTTYYSHLTSSTSTFPVTSITYSSPTATSFSTSTTTSQFTIPTSTLTSISYFTTSTGTTPTQTVTNPGTTTALTTMTTITTSTGDIGFAGALLLLLFMLMPWQSIGSRLEAKLPPSRRQRRRSPYYSTQPELETGPHLAPTGKWSGMRVTRPREFDADKQG